MFDQLPGRTKDDSLSLDGCGAQVPPRLPVTPHYPLVFPSPVPRIHTLFPSAPTDSVGYPWPQTLYDGVGDNRVPLTWVGHGTGTGWMLKPAMLKMKKVLKTVYSVLR